MYFRVVAGMPIPPRLLTIDAIQDDIDDVAHLRRAQSAGNRDRSEQRDNGADCVFKAVPAGILRDGLGV